MTSPIAASAHLALFLPLLETWVGLAHKRTSVAPPIGDVWWMSAVDRVGSFLEAGTRTGWTTRTPIDADTECWDMHLERDGQRYAIRCVAAMQSIGGDEDGRLFLENARRLAEAGQTPDKKPPDETRLQVLFVIPYVRADEGDDDQVRHLRDRWLDRRPLQAAAHAWMGATAPMLRNAAGWAFPGVGLLLQPLYGRWATS